MLYIDQVARRDPNRLAYVMADTGESVTFAELDRRSNQGAHVLRAQGLVVGDHILILMENRREFLETCFAADRSGLYYTTASTQLSADEVLYIARDCGAKLVITSGRFAGVASVLRAQLSPEVPIFMVGEPCAGAACWDDACRDMPVHEIADPAQGLDMLYSSGTTGRPKGVKWPLPAQPPGQMTFLIELLCNLFGYGAQTRYLNPAPLYHAAPLRHTMTTLKRGGSAVIMHKFDAEEALALVEAHRITHSQWVPTMFVRMLKLSDEARGRYDLSSLRMAVHAAAPCPIEVKRQMIDWWGPILMEYYAGTENNGFCALDTEEWLAHPGSVGRAKLGRLHICDEEGEELPPGCEGEVYFANGIPFEYHNDPEKTRKARNRLGWTTLGDIGRVDADGYLYLTDRKSFVIISGGVNIYPQETENTLVTHPAVADAAVFGVPNADFGEEVKAVVELVDGAQASPALADELIAFCRSRLSPIKCPRTVDFRNRLPREPNGKLLKRLLQQEYRQAAKSPEGAPSARSAG